MDTDEIDAPTRLRQWRTNAGLTLQEVSDLTGVDVAYLSKIERGLVTPPGPAWRIKLSRRLGVRIGELFDVDPLEVAL